MSLFETLSLRDVHLRNRIAVSPMCEYSAIDGVAQPWHMVHLGSRAVGGAGLVLSEATAVEARGRISPADTGLWNDAQADAWAPMIDFIQAQGAVAGIQLAHAGRKASTAPPWQKATRVETSQGGWTPVAHQLRPTRMTIRSLRRSTFRESPVLSRRFVWPPNDPSSVDFVLSKSTRHTGYLLHQFLSPLSNHRQDQWGGFENRIRLTRDVVAAVRSVMPEDLPLLVRISATDWVEGGWDIDQSVELCRLLKNEGVDLIDVSSGGLSREQSITLGPGYQVPFAARIRNEAEIATGAVGLITEPKQAEAIVANGEADMILLARELLRDPYWPRRAAKELGVEIEPPKQYARAW